MAVVITRTPWIDDDGTGTTGTVLNNAMKTGLYNEIDTALAKVAQLAGGNTFTGNQTITGLLTVNVVGTHGFAASGAGMQTFLVTNSVAGAGNGASVTISSDIGSQTILASWSSTYSAGPAFNLASGSTLAANGAGGLSVLSAGPTRFYTGAGSVERMRLTPTGAVLVNTPTNPGSGTGLVVVACDTQAVQPLYLQNTNAAASTGWFLLCLNSAAGIAGGIQQATATTVNYVTSSDARLKDDAGPATDLAALRAVLVHDFTWTGDGRRARGVFAQEAHAVFPSAVAVGTDETTPEGTLLRPWGTDYSKFVPDLIVGWQQHDAELAELRAALAAAKG